MKFKIAGVQMNCTKNEQENLDTALSLIRDASSHGAKIICLPELFNTGYYPLEIMKTDGSHLLAHQMLCEASKKLGVYLIAGMPEKTSEAKYNSAFVYSPQGKLSGVYRKNNLFPGVPVNESQCFSPGNCVQPIDTAFCKIGLLICFDLRFPQISRQLALQGAEVLFVPAAWPSARNTHWLALLKARAIENACYVMGVNRCGKDDSIEMGGCSIAIDPNGNELSKLDEKNQGIAVAEVDLQMVRKFREKLPVL